VRFAGARTQGLDESQVAQIDDDYAASSLPAHERAALRLADAIVSTPHPLAAGDAAELRKYFSDAQAAEIAFGLGLFHGLSKALIIMGLEPENMPVTVLPEPGSQQAT
jgi:alkylhydroperoxidase family enzyme